MIKLGSIKLTEKEWLQLRQRAHDQLEAADRVSDDQVLASIEELVLNEFRDHQCSAADKRSIVKRLYYSFRGLDVLQPLLDDESVTEIMVNHHQEIFIEQAGVIRRIDEEFESEEKLVHLIQTIVGKVNRVVNESTPMVDARLADGSRVNVVMPPIALKGPTMTIRKFPDRPFTMDRLIQAGTVTEEAAQLLQQFIRRKYNVFISGGTGSGKTTLLNVLSQSIPEDERIITIEDSAELQLPSVQNLVRLETRNANTEGKGEIAIRELIRCSLRMRPNRIIVGEVRGGEAMDMLQAMNTGHEGSMSTGHANSVKDMLSRLESMVLSTAPLPIEVIRKQISSAIDVVVHLVRWHDHTRKISEITELAGLDQGEYVLNPLFQLAYQGQDCGKLVRTENDLVQQRKWHFAEGVLQP